MSQAERSPGQKSFENTLSFFGKSTAPVDRKTYYPPKHSNQTEEEWARGWEMTGHYLLTDKTLDETGKIYGKTRVRVGQVVKKNMTDLHNASKANVKVQYPLESFKFGKPITLASRKRISLVGGGKSIRVAELAQKGKSAEQISRELGLTLSQIAESRSILKNWGVAVPHRFETSTPEYKENISHLKTQDLSNEEVQKVLDSVTYRTYAQLSKGETPLFNPISTLAKEAGLFISGREVMYLAAILREQRISVGLIERFLSEKPGRNQTVLRYYFIFSGDKERAVEVLKNEQALDRYRTNPVRSLRNEDDAVPSVYQIKFSGSYSSLRNVLAELGYSRFPQQLKRRSLDLAFGDCPIPVFQFRQGYFYEASQKEALKDYLGKRIQELQQKKK